MTDFRDAIRALIDVFTRPHAPLVKWWYACGVRAVLDAFARHIGPCPHATPCQYHLKDAHYSSPNGADVGEGAGPAVCFGPFELAGFLSTAYHPRLIEETIIIRAHEALGAPEGRIGELTDALHARLAAWVTTLQTLRRWISVFWFKAMCTLNQAIIFLAGYIS
eukprot:m.149263 g.149263  ORF g.149263 m.149263 type:complete len:164 (-) comp9728_c1_seq8:333-824(-)